MARKVGGSCGNCWRGLVELLTGISSYLRNQMQKERCSMMLKARATLGETSCNFCCGLSGSICGRTSGKMDTVKVLIGY